MLIKQHPIFYSRIFSAAKVKATLLSFVYVRIQFFTKAVQPFLLLFALLEPCKIVTSQGNFSPFLLRRPLEPCKTETSQVVKSQGWYCTLPFHSMLCTVSSTNLLLSQRRVPTHPDYLLKNPIVEIIEFHFVSPRVQAMHSWTFSLCTLPVQVLIP